MPTRSLSTVKGLRVRGTEDAAVTYPAPSSDALGRLGSGEGRRALRWRAWGATAKPTAGIACCGIAVGPHANRRSDEVVAHNESRAQVIAFAQALSDVS
jgi:hypothetical protein